MLHRAWVMSLAVGLVACGDDDVKVVIDAAEQVDARPMLDAPIDAPIDAPLVTVHSIQEVQDGTVTIGTTVAVDKVFVTALRISTAGNMLAFVQEPDGVTTGGHTYPEYAGMRLFVSASEIAQFSLGALQIGDCISVTASTIEFQDDTQLLMPTAAVVEPAGSCGTAPTPFVIPAGAVDFDALATDTDAVTVGDQPGASAEIYEGVLVRITDVTAPVGTDVTSGEFRVVKTGGGGATLVIGKPVYTNNGPVPATAGQAFASITGVFAQRINFQLLPRTVVDLQ